jgi:hypothetical protein
MEMGRNRYDTTCARRPFCEDSIMRGNQLWDTMILCHYRTREVYMQVDPKSGCAPLVGDKNPLEEYDQDTDGAMERLRLSAVILWTRMPQMWITPRLYVWSL